MGRGAGHRGSGVGACVWGWVGVGKASDRGGGV